MRCGQPAGMRAAMAQAAHSGRPPSFIARRSPVAGEAAGGCRLQVCVGLRAQHYLGTAALVASRIVIFLRQPKLSTHAAVACVAWAAWARLRGFARPPSAAQ